jgi:hypothetical protein
MLRKVALFALVVVSLLGVGFGALVISSLSYDEANPRDRPNAYYSVESVVIDRPVADVFRFVQHQIPSVYTRMSPMHEKFEILNAEALVEGAVIDCVEGDAKEVVRNRYVVTEVIENRLIAMASTPTRVYDRASGEPVAEVDVWDYFDFEPLGPRRTRLVQTVVLDMKSPVLKSVIDIAAFLSGTRSDWERQFEEQLQNLAAFAEGSGSGR